MPIGELLALLLVGPLSVDAITSRLLKYLKNNHVHVGHAQTFSNYHHVLARHYNNSLPKCLYIGGGCAEEKKNACNNSQQLTVARFWREKALGPGTFMHPPPRCPYANVPHLEVM